jgi:hypothetical protein
VNKREFIMAASSAALMASIPRLPKATEVLGYPGVARFSAMINQDIIGKQFTLIDGAQLKDCVFRNCFIWLEGPIETYGRCRAVDCRFCRAPQLRAGDKT